MFNISVLIICRCTIKKNSWLPIKKTIFQLWIKN